MSFFSRRVAWLRSHDAFTAVRRKRSSRLRVVATKCDTQLCAREPGTAADLGSLQKVPTGQQGGRARLGAEKRGAPTGRTREGRPPTNGDGAPRSVFQRKKGGAPFDTGGACLSPRITPGSNSRHAGPRPATPRLCLGTTRPCPRRPSPGGRGPLPLRARALADGHHSGRHGHRC